MGSYIINFTVYTLAMSGLIFFALYVYKKFMGGTFHGGNSKMLSVEETLSINPRKSLMIVKAGSERFLIASDVDKTTLISKLEENELTKSFEKFENIPKEPDIEPDLLVNNEIPIFPVEDFKQDLKPVHLEIIKEKNPSSQRRKKSSKFGKSIAQSLNENTQV